MKKTKRGIKTTTLTVALIFGSLLLGGCSAFRDAPPKSTPRPFTPLVGGRPLTEITPTGFNGIYDKGWDAVDNHPGGKLTAEAVEMGEFKKSTLYAHSWPARVEGLRATPASGPAHTFFRFYIAGADKLNAADSQGLLIHDQANLKAVDATGNIPVEELVSNLLQWQLKSKVNLPQGGSVEHYEFFIVETIGDASARFKGDADQNSVRFWTLRK